MPSFGFSRAESCELAQHSILACIKLQFAEQGQLHDAVVVHSLPYQQSSGLGCKATYQCRHLFSPLLSRKAKQLLPEEAKAAHSQAGAEETLLHPSYVFILCRSFPCLPPPTGGSVAPCSPPCLSAYCSAAALSASAHSRP